MLAIILWENLYFFADCRQGQNSDGIKAYGLDLSGSYQELKFIGHNFCIADLGV